MTNSTLPDDRIDKMRLSIMHSVDQDIRRRGRRTRTALGLVAASVVVVGLGSYAVTSADQQVSSSDSSSGASASLAEDSAGGLEKAEVGAAPGDRAVPAPDADREVVTTGDVSVTVKDPQAVAQKLSSFVESVGGRVDSRDEIGSGDGSSASVTVRVPSSRVTATVERLKTYGTVTQVSLQNVDVTSQATDLDARIDALKVSVDRLETIIGDAISSAELIKAEDALTSRQEQLESLQAQRTGLADQVSLSTLSVNLSQRDQVDSVEPGGFTGGLRDGWNSLVSTLNAVVEAAGTLLPWALVALLAYGLVRVVTRAVRRRARS